MQVNIMDMKNKKGINKIKSFECSKCQSKNVFMQKVANNTSYSTYLICGDCGKKITILKNDDIKLVERFLSNDSTNPDCIQCAACGNLSMPKAWFDIFGIKSKIKACPYCGTLRYMYEGNRNFRLGEHKECVSSTGFIKNELGELMK